MELALKNVKESKMISEKNKKAILDFCSFCFAEGLSVERVEHYARILKKIAEIFRRDFEEATKADDYAEEVKWIRVVTPSRTGLYLNSC